MSRKQTTNENDLFLTWTYGVENTHHSNIATINMYIAPWDYLKNEPRYSGYRSNDASELKLYCQCDWDGDSFKTYAWEVRISESPHFKSSWEVEQYMKLLKLVHKILESFPTRALTFGQFASFVASSLKLKGMRRRSDRNQGWHHYANHEIASCIDSHIENFRQTTLS